MKFYGDTNRALGKNKNLEQIFGDQLSLQGCFKTGSIKHQFFTGADWENSLATAYTFTFAEKAISINNDGKYTANYYDMINLFSFDPATQRNDIPKNVTNTQIVTTRHQPFWNLCTRFNFIHRKNKTFGRNPLVLARITSRY